MRYVKIKMSLGDKMKLLFFGIIAESKLPEVEKVVLLEGKTTGQPTIEMTDEINTKEPEKLDIPFFDLGDDDVKSNF
jgi:hypothetical protein